MAYKPLTEAELDDIGIEPPLRLACPQCDGELQAEDNALGTLVFLTCIGKCHLCWYVLRKPTTSKL